jgi:hypothetical protein
VSLSADVLIHTYNNKKGAGLLALYNEASGKKGLALTLYDAGNTDTLVLATVDQAGKLATLKTVSLGAAIAENAWYRVSMDVSVGAGQVSVVGTVFRHETPTDPRQRRHHAGGADAHLLRHARDRRSARRRCDRRSWYSVRRRKCREQFQRDQHHHRAVSQRRRNATLIEERIAAAPDHPEPVPAIEPRRARAHACPRVPAGAISVMP